MADGKQLWAIWQRLLAWFAPVFTRRGWVRFAQWVSGTVLCDEQHTITQEVTRLGLADQWRNWEHFAEYGAFDLRAAERAVMALVEREHPCRFARYHPAAVDDTKALRASRGVWGVCTFAHANGRDPKRPKVATAHNWVLMGDLAPPAAGWDEPWTYLPTASRLYVRKAQLPAGEAFRTKNELAVAMLRQLDGQSAAPVLGVFDGGYAHATVVRPCLGVGAVGAAADRRRVEILTRPRRDARLFRLPPPPPPPKGKGKGVRGRPRKWGRRLPPPREHGRWGVPWRAGEAFVYGRRRRFRWRQVQCLWSVSGPDVPVHVFAFEVEGYRGEPWFVVTSASDLTAAQALAAYAARYRQEDAIRDHKQRLGMEEVRAWTKAPVPRTFLVQWLSLTLLRTLLRLLQWEWEKCGGGRWWSPPPWDRHKSRPSVLDVRRLLWGHREEFSQFLRQMDEVREKRPAATRRRAAACTTMKDP